MRSSTSRVSVTSGRAECDLAPVQAQHAVPRARLLHVVRRDQHGASLRRRGRRSAPSSRAALGSSSPEKGSSSSSTSASCTSARATSTRWRWPPESSPKVSPARSARPTAPSASSGQAALGAARPPPPRHAPQRPHQRDVERAHRVVEPRALGLRDDAAPAVHRRPCRRATCSSPSSARNSVVLPPPLGPSTPTRIPRVIVEGDVLDRGRARVAGGQAAGGDELTASAARIASSRHPRLPPVKPAHDRVGVGQLHLQVRVARWSRPARACRRTARSAPWRRSRARASRRPSS